MADIDSIVNRVKSYNPQADVEIIRRAYEFASEAHKDQKRLTGDPYITHPLAAAEILADLEMDEQPRYIVRNDLGDAANAARHARARKAHRFQQAQAKALRV